MSDAERHRKKDQARRKKSHFLLKAFLALVILLVILGNVKVRDHLSLPSGTPFEGTYPGLFEQLGSLEEERISFREENLFYFEATHSRGKIVSAFIRGKDGSPLHEYSSDQVKRIVLKKGLITVIKKINPMFWVLSILIYFLAMSLTTIRWGLLLKAADLPQNFIRAYRLTFVGFFFNNVIPGQTGGDLVRAYYVARENESQRTNSIITVIVDRGMGIIALALIGALVIPTNFEQYGKSAVLIYGFIGLVVVGSLIYYSKRIRRFLRLSVLFSKLPYQEFFQNLDRSFFLYRYRKATMLVCLLMSFAVHLIIITSIWVLGRGLGIDLSFLSYMANIPIIFILSSIPLTPAGWGVGELVFMVFLPIYPVQATALSIVFRLNATLVSLLGGLFLLLERDRINPGDIGVEGVNPEETDLS